MSRNEAANEQMDMGGLMRITKKKLEGNLRNLISFHYEETTSLYYDHIHKFLFHSIL